MIPFDLNSKTSLDTAALSQRLEKLASAQKNKNWIRNDLTVSQSNAISRAFWKIVKRFNWLRSHFYHVNLEETKGILEKLSPQIGEKGSVDLQNLFIRAINNYNQIAPKHSITVPVFSTVEATNTSQSSPSQVGSKEESKIADLSNEELDQKIQDHYDAYHVLFNKKVPPRDVQKPESDDFDEFFKYMFVDTSFNNTREKHLKNVHAYLVDLFKPIPKESDESSSAWNYTNFIDADEMSYNRLFEEFIKDKTFQGKPFPIPDFIKNSSTCETDFRKNSSKFETAETGKDFEWFFSLFSPNQANNQSVKKLEEIFGVKIETLEDLNRHYKNWVKTNHPDRKPEKEQKAATELFQEVRDLMDNAKKVLI